MADTLSERIHQLPRELLDAIYAHVFTSPAGGEQRITRDYRPPIQLQISRALRAQFAREYYSTTAFVFYDEDDMQCWLEAIGRPQFALIRRLSFLISSNDDEAVELPAPCQFTAMYHSNAAAWRWILLASKLQAAGGFATQ